MRIDTQMAPSTGSGEKSLAETLARHPFLAGLRPDHIRILSQNAMRVAYEPGESIFRETDPANRFYLIESGEVLLEAGSPTASPAPIQTLGPGEVLGWSWLFPPYVWLFSARAIEPTTAIYGTRLREHCDDNPELGYELMKRIAAVVIQRLQETRRLYLVAREIHLPAKK
jgi:CRP-like cAMP-binding protein